MSEEVVLQFKDITFGYGGTLLFEKLNLSLYGNKIYAILGPDGAGKTTLLRLAVGVYTPQGGEVYLLGVNPRRRERVVGKFGYLPQRFSLYGDLTVEENLLFYGKSFNLKGEVLEEKICDLLERVGLSEFRGRLARNLSGGMKKKLGVICNLLHEPDILLLDEPTTGIDPVSRAELWEFLLTLSEERGTTLVFTTPYMEEAERADEIIFLHKGKIKARGSLEDLKNKTPIKVYQLKGPMDLLKGVASEIPRELIQWTGNTLRITLPEGIDLSLPKKVEIKSLEPNLEDLFLAQLWKS
jgi:ABC-2 type transport system ATP-binding protein